MSLRSTTRSIRTAFIFLALAVLHLAVCTPAQSANIAIGAQLPEISIQNKGELVRQDGAFIYTPWNTSLLLGKVQVVHYLAARLTASKLHEPFTDALRTAAFPAEKYESTSLINVNDALWGTAGFVESELKTNKIKFPHERLVSDVEGIGLKQWELRRGNSVIVILDKSGKVIFLTENALSPNQIADVLALIRNNL
jgi:YtfJ family uncharacterized protein